MAVQLAEALAEWSHARMRKERGYGDLEPDNIRAVLNDYPIKLIVYDKVSQEIETWID
jgi:hypothetical protein